MLVDKDIIYVFFSRNFTSPMSINKGKMTIPKGVHANLVRNALISSHSLLLKSFKRRSNHLEIVWLEV